MKFIANPVEVEALKIVETIRVGPSVLVHLENDQWDTATPEMCSRHIPKAGDYWVIQSDGYVYVNPKDVFERKYSEAQSVKPKYVVGVSVLITNEKGQVLLGERLNSDAAGWLSTPGGRIEPEENMWDCAAREAKQETGLEVTTLDLLGVREHFRFGMHYFMIYMHAKEWGGEVQNLEPDKCNNWEWFDLRAIPQKCTEPDDVLHLLPRGVADEEHVVRPGRPYFGHIYPADKPVVPGTYTAGDDDVSHGVLTAGAELAAVIVKVNEDETVNLHAFAPDSAATLFLPGVKFGTEHGQCRF